MMLAGSCNRGSEVGTVETRTAAVTTTTTVTQFLLYAQRSLKLGADDHANGGDLGVRLRAPTSFGSQLALGTTVLVDTHHTLFAPSVSLAAHAAVGKVDTDALVNSGATAGAVAAFPAADMPPGPIAGGVAGTTAVTVASGANRTLDPGSYGALSVGGIVYLKPGSYTFASVTIADHGQLVAKGGGTSTVFVTGQLGAGTHVTLSSLAGGAASFALVVGGNDTTKSAATIGTYASIVALIAAPNGTLSLGDHTDATGAFAGFDVVAGQAVVMTYQAGFPAAPATPAPQPLTGYVTPAIATAPVVGPVPGSTVLDLEIGLALPDRAGLIQKFHDLSDPSSASFRHYLTPAALTAAYSPSQASYTALTSWATAAGFTITDATANRLLLGVRGTAAQIEQALSTGLVYRARPDGTSFYAPDRDPAVTLPATNPIFRISGLDNQVIAQPGAVPGTVTAPGAAAGPNGLYATRDFRAAYASCTASTGAGEKVGLFELDGFKGADLTTYGCKTGLVTCDAKGAVTAGSLPAVSTVLVDGYGGGIQSTNGQGEVTIDIQMAMAMAPGLSGVVVFEQTNDGSTAHHNHILSKMAADTTIRQFSSSWFFNVDGNTQTLLYALAMQGQSFMQCGGDEGSYSWGTDPGDIRDLEAVTVVGGTQLTMTGAFTYQSEATWNSGGGSGGGGIAANTASPVYQAPFSRALGQEGKRLLPDLALVAISEYGTLNGADQNFGGTSLAAPLYASWIALSNQQSLAAGLGVAGFTNPFLYDVASAPTAIYNASFNDIADGSTNGGTCPSGRGSGYCPGGKWAPDPTSKTYVAATGYDMATGLGSPKCALMNEMATGVLQTPPFDGGATDATVTNVDGGPDAPEVVPLGAPTIHIVATEGFRGVEFCMQGDGFPEGSPVQFKFLDLPGGLPTQDEIESPLIAGTGGRYTDFDSTFGGGASSEHGFLGCSASDAAKSMTIEAYSVSDPTRNVTASISNAWICGQEPLQDGTDQTPLWDPGPLNDTCPLPPE